MREGMLWFDNNEQRDLRTKIERAAEYYTTKYGVRPTTVFIHPTAADGVPAPVEDIEIRQTNTVLPNHFWLGVLDQSKASAQ